MERGPLAAPDRARTLSEHRPGGHVLRIPPSRCAPPSQEGLHCPSLNSGMSRCSRRSCDAACGRSRCWHWSQWPQRLPSDSFRRGSTLPPPAFFPPAESRTGAAGEHGTPSLDGPERPGEHQPQARVASRDRRTDRRWADASALTFAGGKQGVGLFGLAVGRDEHLRHLP